MKMDIVRSRSTHVTELDDTLLMELPFFDTIYARAGLTERFGSILGGEVPAIFVGGSIKELSNAFCRAEMDENAT